MVYLSWYQRVQCSLGGPVITFGAHVTEARLASELCCRIQESLIRSSEPAQVMKTAG
jgi:hypothetical protein